MIQIATGKANLGIDFAGGTSIQLKFEKPVVLHDVRKALEEGGLKDFDPSGPAYRKQDSHKGKKTEQKLGQTSSEATGILSRKFSGNKYVVDSTTEIGPKVGGKLRADAAMAIGVAVLGILAYVAFRFKFNFGVGATIATFHDVLAVLGIFILWGAR